MEADSPSTHPVLQALLLESIGQAIVATDLQGKVAYWNPIAERLYGWRETEALGREFADLELFGATSQGSTALLAGLNDGAGWTGELPMRHRDGRAVPVFATINPVVDHNGRRIGTLGVFADLRLRDGSALLLHRLLAEFTNGIALVLNRDWQIVFNSGNGLAGPVGPAGSVADELVADLLERDVLEHAGPYIQRSFDGESLRLEVEHRGRYYEVQMGPMDARDGRVETIGIFARALGQRRDREREREALLQNERQARRENYALLQATAELAAEASPQDLLRKLLVYAAGLVQADEGLYALAEGDRPLQPVRWRDGQWTEDEAGLNRDEGITGLVWRTRRAYRTNDLGSDPNASRRQRVRWHATSLLSAPLCDLDGSVIGVVQLTNSRRPEGFNEHDEMLLSGFCNYASAAVYRAREIERRRAAEEAPVRMEGVLLTARAVAHRLNQELAVIMGRAEILHQLLGDTNPQLHEHLSQIRAAATEIAQMTAQLQRANRVVTESAPGLGPMLDIDASSSAT